MHTKQDNQLKYVQFPGLPLMVYREIAAHLRQVEGVETGLYPSQAEQFDYKVVGACDQYSQTAGEESRERGLRFCYQESLRCQLGRILRLIGDSPRRNRNSAIHVNINGRNSGITWYSGHSAAEVGYNGRSSGTADFS